MTSSLDLHYLVKEFQFLADAKIDQIYAPSKKEVLLQLHVPSKGKRILRISAPDYCYLIERREEAPAPSDFCMFLRKKLANARLRKISQIGFERIIRFDFEAKDSPYSIVAELFSTGNIILLKENTILSASEYRKWAGRVIRPKEGYVYPKRDINLLELDSKEFEVLVKKTDRESVVKFLAIDLGLGGIYAEEVCLAAGIDKNLKPSEFKDIQKLFKSVDGIRNKSMNPVAYMKDNIVSGVFPFEMQIYKSYEKEKFETFSSALERFVELKGEISEEEKEYLKKLEKLEKVVSEQKDSIKKLEKDIEQNNKKAEIIYSNYQLVQEIIDELKKAEKKYSWKEIKEKLKNHKIIKDINPKEKTVVLEL